MLFAFACLSSSWMQCFAVSAPAIGGNPLTQWVTHNYNTIQGVEVSGVSVQEYPPVTEGVHIDGLASYFVNKRLLNASKADEVAKRVRYIGNYRKVIHTFSSEDNGHLFYQLPDSQRNAGNFFNKLIKRNSVLLDITNNGGNLVVKSKVVDASIKKRKAQLAASTQQSYQPCDEQVHKCGYVTKTEMKCGYKPVSSFQCGFVGSSYQCGTVTTQQFSCDNVPTQSYECKWETQTQNKWIPYQVYKWDFIPNYDQQEVQDLYNQIESAAASKINL